MIAWCALHLPLIASSPADVCKQDALPTQQYLNPQRGTKRQHDAIDADVVEETPSKKPKLFTAAINYLFGRAISRTIRTFRAACKAFQRVGAEARKMPGTWPEDESALPFLLSPPVATVNYIASSQQSAHSPNLAFPEPRPSPVKWTDLARKSDSILTATIPNREPRSYYAPKIRVPFHKPMVKREELAEGQVSTAMRDIRWSCAERRAATRAAMAAGLNATAVYHAKLALPDEPDSQPIHPPRESYITPPDSEEAVNDKIGEEEIEIPIKLPPGVVALAAAYKYDNDLSTLEDAPPLFKPKRSVRWAGEAVIKYADNNGDPITPPIYPTNTKYYVKHEVINEPLFESGNDYRSPKPEPSPATTIETPCLETPLVDSPANVSKLETPDGMEELGVRFKNFGYFVPSAKKDESVRTARKKKTEDRKKVLEEQEKKKDQERKKSQQNYLRKIAEEKAKRLAKQKIIKELTPEWDEKVDQAMAKSSSAELTTNLTRKDLGTLLPTTRADGIGWLNDEVVNAYLTNVANRRLEQTGYTKKADEVPKYHAFNTHLFSTWKAKGYQGVARWSGRAKIGGKKFLSTEKVLIPINDRSHWTLISVSGTKRTIEYYDSMSGNPERYLNFAKDYVAGVLQADYKADEWKIIDASSQQQANGVDCGVFVCMNGHALLAGKNPLEAFEEPEIPTARRMVAATLLGNEVKVE